MLIFPKTLREVRFQPDSVLPSQHQRNQKKLPHKYPCFASSQSTFIIWPFLMCTWNVLEAQWTIYSGSALNQDSLLLDFTSMGILITAAQWQWNTNSFHVPTEVSNSLWSLGAHSGISSTSKEQKLWFNSSLKNLKSGIPLLTIPQEFGSHREAL